MMNIRRHKVKKFPNCPNPDCSAHYPAIQFDKEMAPRYAKERAEGKTMMVCSHCSMVWYEEPHIDSRRYTILRNAANNWIEETWTEIYTLLTRRKNKRR